jgi:DNA-binding beta-propeller fold protein YncE
MSKDSLPHKLASGANHYLTHMGGTMATAIRLATVNFVVSFVLSVGTARAEKIVLVAGEGESGGDGPARATKLQMPFSVDFDREGNLFIAEFMGQRVRKLDRKGNLTTIAGTGEKGYGGDNGPATKARFNGIHNLVVAPNGNIIIADTFNKRVRLINARSGEIRTIAGTGEKGFSGDGGTATKAQFGDIYCVALDPKGEQLYLADLDNRRIRVLNLESGVVQTVAGNGEKGIPTDGSEARKAPLVDPRAVAVDGKGNVYILEREGHSLRRVDSEGKIRTVAGTGKPGFGGDGGDPLRAQFRGPKHLCVDRNGDVVIADTENHAIRKFLTQENKIIRIAGTGRAGRGGLDGPPLNAELNQPHGVNARPDGSIYISDSTNNRVLRIEP